MKTFHGGRLRRPTKLGLTLCTCLPSCLLSAVAHPQAIAWTRQIGTPGFDYGESVSADGLGNVYLSGIADGNLEGNLNSGLHDAFVQKYDDSGALLWTRLLGSSGHDQSAGVSADGLGHVYITGLTEGDLNGPNAGATDAFISKYDSTGTLLWTRQLGTSAYDYGQGISADGLGNVYVSGTTLGSLGAANAGQEDVFVSKYDAAGDLLWTRQLGTSGRDSGSGTSVSADGLGNVYISSGTTGDLAAPVSGEADAFVSKFDASGALQWTRQFGTSELDYSHGTAADSLGNVYLTGITRGSLGGAYIGGLYDIFVSKFDVAGIPVWTRQFGTNARDVSSGISVDELGFVYIAGDTDGILDASSAAGTRDAFIIKLDSAGALIASRQFGTVTVDEAHGVSADGLGGAYISGITYGNLGGPLAGNHDAFLMKVTIPEPSSAVLALIWFACSWGVLKPRRSNRANYPALSLP